MQGQGRLAEAAGRYERALQLRSDHVGAHANLGVTLAGQRKLEPAVAHLREAVRLRPDFAEAHHNLGVALADLGRFDEAEACHREALRLNPAYADAHGNMANLYKEQGRLDEALAGYQVALWLQPDSALAHWNRALAWLQKGDFTQGWLEYEWRWRRKQTPPRAFRQPNWDGSPLGGRTILLYMEQGLGDMLQFIRYAPLVKERGGTVIVECPRFLIPLFSSCRGIDRLVAEGDSLPEFDVQAPLLSLPRIFQTTLETVPATVPYLFPDASLVDKWQQRLASVDGFRIGISWQGNPQHQWDRHRSIPLQEFAALARLPSVRLISLQKGAGTEQLKSAGFEVIEFGDELDTASGAFMDSAAIIKSLDLVITVDSAIAHLAGALGARVWLALAAIVDWRWMFGREDSPWYPTMRLFRQPKLGDWTSVFERMASEVSKSNKAELKAVNEKLWDVEDEIRRCEKSGDSASISWNWPVQSAGTMTPGSSSKPRSTSC